MLFDLNALARADTANELPLARRPVNFQVGRESALLLGLNSLHWGDRAHKGVEAIHQPALLSRELAGRVRSKDDAALQTFDLAP